MVIDLLVKENENLLANLPITDLNNSNVVLIDNKGSIPIYTTYDNFIKNSIVEHNDLFYNNLKDKIGIFENNIFIKKSVYSDYIKDVLDTDIFTYLVFFDFLKDTPLVVELDIKGYFSIPLSENPIYNLFKITYYNDSIIFFDYLSKLKITSKDTNILVDSTKWLNNYDKDNAKNIFVSSLDTLILKRNLINETNNNQFFIISLFDFDIINSIFNFDIQINLFIKILPFIFSVFGFCVYYLLDDRFVLYYHNYYYRLIILKFYNGLFFDKLFIDVLLSKFYLFSYYSFYKNLESSFFQKYNIYIFEKNIFNLYFFLKIFSKGYFFVYILIVLCFIFFYFLIFFILNFLNYTFLPMVLILFIFSFVCKWKILKNYIKNFLMQNLYKI